MELQDRAGWANDPKAIKVHRIRPTDLKNAPRIPTILPKVKTRWRIGDHGARLQERARLPRL